MEKVKHLLHILRRPYVVVKSLYRNRRPNTRGQLECWNVGMGEDWQGMLKRLPSNWQEQAVKRGRVATRAQTGPGDRFAASTAGVCRVWVFLSAVGAVGNAGGSGVLIGTSVAQAGGACPGVDRLALGSPDWVASGTRLVAQHQRTHPVGGWQSSPGSRRKRRQRADALRL